MTMASALGLQTTVHRCSSFCVVRTPASKSSHTLNRSHWTLLWWICLKSSRKALNWPSPDTRSMKLVVTAHSQSTCAGRTQTVAPSLCKQARWCDCQQEGSRCLNVPCHMRQESRQSQDWWADGVTYACFQNVPYRALLNAQNIQLPSPVMPIRNVVLQQCQLQWVKNYCGSYIARSWQEIGVPVGRWQCYFVRQ